MKGLDTLRQHLWTTDIMVEFPMQRGLAEITFRCGMKALVYTDGGFHSCAAFAILPLWSRLSNQHWGLCRRMVNTRTWSMSIEPYSTLPVYTECNCQQPNGH